MKYFRSYILFLIVLSFGLLIACSDNEGPDSIEEPPTADTLPICFVGAGAEAQTRAIGSSLSQYAKDFRLYGVNHKSGASSCDLVFQNYVVWYDAAAGSTTTNSSAWEYVGTHPATASPASSDLLYTSSDKINSDGSTPGSTTWQSIKYWDQSADYYYFWGIAKAGSVKKMVPNVSNGCIESVTFPTTFTTSNITDIYYTDPVYVPKANYGLPVEMPFKTLAAKIRVGFYETIPGVLVSDLKFYPVKDDGTFKTADDEPAVTEEEKSPKPILSGNFATSAKLTMKFSYEPADKPKTSFTASSPEGSATIPADNYMTLGALAYSSDKTATRTEDDMNAVGIASVTSFLGNTSTAPTYSEHTEGDVTTQYYTILPAANSDGMGLSLLCDYTITKTDARGSSYTVLAQPATVPAAYCNWQPNYLYTYIFKITNEGDGGIVLYDVKIEPWNQSGTAEQEWHNW